MKRILGMLTCAILMAACQTSSSLTLQPLIRHPTPALTPVFSSSQITKSNARNLVELTDLPESPFGPVAALSFTTVGNHLFVIHSGEGVLQQWSVRDKQLLKIVKIGKVGMTAAAFDGQANYLAVGEAKTPRTAEAHSVGKFNGTRLWDARTGNLLWQTVPVTSFVGGYPKTDVALSLDGKWLIETDSYAVTVWNVEEKKPAASEGIAQSIGEDPVLASITAVAIDAVGEWYAYTTYKGEFTIEDRVTFATPQGRIWKAELPDSGIPLAITFDAARTHLAIATTKSLVVWNLQNNGMFKAPLPENSIANLAFSPDGSLLAVGTSSGWQIWSMLDGELLIENTRPTYAVAFSPDGRLFAWGDANGVVHVWGVKEQN